MLVVQSNIICKEFQKAAVGIRLWGRYLVERTPCSRGLLEHVALGNGMARAEMQRTGKQ